MRDDSSLRRQWVLLQTLSSQRLGVTVHEMADELGVSRKTVRRDLDLFRGLGLPLEEDVGRFGRKTWRLTRGGGLPPLGFSFDEAAALYLGHRLLEPLAGTVFWDAALRASQKVRASLGKAALDYLGRFAGLFHHTAFGRHDYARRAGLIDALQLAAEDGKPIRLSYHSERAVRPTEREVHPYGLVYHRGALYLVARDPAADKVKHYKIDRVEAAEVAAGSFPRPPGFDLAAHLAATFGVYQSDGELTTVKVRFAPEAARYVQESEWQEGQRVTRRRDGGVEVEFRLSGTEEVKRWLLSFGARAVVLEPERLRREIAQELRTLLASYEPIESLTERPSLTEHPRP